MPAVTSVIDTITAVPLASLAPVKDDDGPYSFGHYLFGSFRTAAPHGTLPAGVHDVEGTYGIIAQVAGTFPPAAGFDSGWVDPFGIIRDSGERYHQLIGQVNLIHYLPLAGSVGVITDRFDLHYNGQLFLYPIYLFSPLNVGLYVGPGWSIDLFYMCVFA
jgi:hypothetical protein